MPSDAGFGWRVEVKTVSSTPSELIVHVDWQRLWDHNQTLVNGPQGSVQLTLHPGDRLPLDMISAAPIEGGCSAVGMALEVSFVGAASNGAVGVAGRGGASVGAGGSGGGIGRGSGSGSGVGAGAVSAPAGGISSKTFPVTGFMSVTSGFDPQTLEVVDAELWLVHTLPNGVEEVQYQIVRTAPGSGDYAFAPVRITTPQDDYSVSVTGLVQAQRQAGGVEKVFLSLLRAVINPDGSQRIHGGSGKTLDMPKPGEVLSFAIPGGLNSARARITVAPQPPAGPPTSRDDLASLAASLKVVAQMLESFDGHKFSVRLRVNR
jgi:hypothetical protein